MLTVYGPMRVLVVMSAVLLLSGCASFARGVTSAILSPENDEVRKCEVTGNRFDGIYQIMEGAGVSAAAERKTIRMLFVHGIGEHKDNYSRPFVENIADRLGLDYRSREQKRIQMSLASRSFAGIHERGELGPLLVSRYLNRDKTRELLIFEVNWSDFNKPERDQLNREDVAPKGFQATINGQVKSFFNQQVVDPIRYIGESSAEIRAYVREAACWMVSAEWDDFRSSAIVRDDKREQLKVQFCPVIQQRPGWQEKVEEIIERDNFIAVTHSLGSRIFLDSFSIFDANVRESDNPFIPLRNAFSNKRTTLIMLANQLPLLQLGLDDRGFPANQLDSQLPADRFIPWENDQRYAYSIPGYDMSSLPTHPNRGSLCRSVSDRRFRQMSIITVNDPNDLLSYQLSDDYKKRYVDWALCPRFTDITIEVVQPANVFGVTFADPGGAHGNYWSDPGLADILMRGFGDDKSDPSVPEEFQSRLRHKVTAFERGKKVEYECKGRLDAEIIDENETVLGRNSDQYVRLNSISGMN